MHYIDSHSITYTFSWQRAVGIIAQLFGKSDYREISKTILRNVLIAVVVSIFIILSKNFILILTNTFFSTSLETQELIKTYISVRVLSVPAELIIYVIVGFYFTNL